MGLHTKIEKRKKIKSQKHQKFWYLKKSMFMSLNKDK